MAKRKREIIIKIRVFQEEVDSMKKKIPNTPLAEWMRQTCLDESKSISCSIVDPALIRQLAMIGNNLNQIARVMNREQWAVIDRVAVTVSLGGIEEQLMELKETCKKCTSNSCQLAEGAEKMPLNTC